MTLNEIQAELYRHGFARTGFGNAYIYAKAIDGAVYRAYIGGIGPADVCENKMLCCIIPHGSIDTIGGVIQNQFALRKTLSDLKAGVRLLPLTIQQKPEGFQAECSIDMGSYNLKAESGYYSCRDEAKEALRRRVYRGQVAGKFPRFEFAFLNQPLNTIS